ncbi:MAG: trehalose-phosphatase [Hyphomicrobium sp.]|nr:trehalose-phosphatase [Hyphomicrobium sp.]
MKHQAPVLARFESYALFLDIDGTLSDIAPSPDGAFIDSATLQAVERLSDELGGALAVISGRKLTDIDRLIGRSAQNAAGSHGAELRKSGHLLNVSAAPVIDTNAIEKSVRDRFSGASGLLIECKPFSVALHYRANPTLAEAVEVFVDHIVRTNDGLTKVKGKMIVEIVPADVNKGSAIASFMSREPFLGRIPVFAGDDTTDEHGFETVNALEGVSIKIGDGPSCARYRFDDAAQFRQWLTRLGSARRSTD